MTSETADFLDGLFREPVPAVAEPERTADGDTGPGFDGWERRPDSRGVMGWQRPGLGTWLAWEDCIEPIDVPEWPPPPKRMRERPVGVMLRDGPTSDTLAASGD